MLTKDALKKFRDDLCLQQTELALLLGVSKQAVWHWETGRKNPSRPHVRQIMELVRKHKLKYTPEDFLGE